MAAIVVVVVAGVAPIQGLRRLVDVEVAVARLGVLAVPGVAAFAVGLVDAGQRSASPSATAKVTNLRCEQRNGRRCEVSSRQASPAMCLVLLTLSPSHALVSYRTARRRQAASRSGRKSAMARTRSPRTAQLGRAAAEIRRTARSVAHAFWDACGLTRRRRWRALRRVLRRLPRDLAIGRGIDGRGFAALDDDGVAATHYPETGQYARDAADISRLACAAVVGHADRPRGRSWDGSSPSSARRPRSRESSPICAARSATRRVRLRSAAKSSSRFRRSSVVNSTPRPWPRSTTAAARTTSSTRTARTRGRPRLRVCHAGQRQRVASPRSTDVDVTAVALCVWARARAASAGLAWGPLTAASRSQRRWPPRVPHATPPPRPRSNAFSASLANGRASAAARIPISRTGSSRATCR